MASIVHPAGIWSVPEDENRSSKDPGTYVLSTRHTCTQTDTQHVSTGQIVNAKEDDRLSSATVELARMQNVRHAPAARPSDATPASQPVGTDLGEEQGHAPPPMSRGIPPELPNLAAEIIFVVTCSGGQLVSALLIGHVAVTQAVFGAALDISSTQTPWLLGASMLPCGLSVVISGSLTDLISPKPLIVGAFAQPGTASVARLPRCATLIMSALALPLSTVL